MAAGAMKRESLFANSYGLGEGEQSSGLGRIGPGGLMGICCIGR